MSKTAKDKGGQMVSRLKTKCIHCEHWDNRKGKKIFHMANMTDWLPQAGYDPNLRQFKCVNCGKLSYKLLTEDDLFQLWKTEVVNV